MQGGGTEREKKLRRSDIMKNRGKKKEKSGKCQTSTNYDVRGGNRTARWRGGKEKRTPIKNKKGV